MSTPSISPANTTKSELRPIPRLRSVFKKSSPPMDRYIADRSGSTGARVMTRHQRITQLTSILYNKNSSSADIAKAAKALGQYGLAAKNAIPALIQVLKKYRQFKIVASHPHYAFEPSEPMKVLRSVAEALGNMGAAARAAESELIAVLKRKHQPNAFSRAHRATVAALKKIRPSSTTSAMTLLKMLLDSNKDAEFRIAAADTLGYLGNKNIYSPTFIRAMGKGLVDSDKDVRKKTILAFQRMGSIAKPSVPVLLERVKKDQEIDLRVKAAIAVRYIDPSKNAAIGKALLPTLTRLSKDQFAMTRQETVWHFRSVAWIVGYNKVVPLLQRMARHDSDPDVQKNAALALVHIDIERKRARK